MTTVSSDAITFTVEALTPTIGAVVDGLDLAAPLAPAVAAEVRAALVERGVLFFRDQHLDPTAQVAFAGHFGELTPAHPLQGGIDADHPEVLVLDSAAYALGVGERTGRRATTAVGTPT